ncbi:hypothetical protein GCM10022225_52000 [Plantactinospora mayteni]|uniref:Uncharacterized protein n=1 Tax=Plantactinospora mayteni TaxID=566021 RepID=A0ABQ4EYZ0_9ACTN|nr:hypothetical protein Pma05_64560 [Plantactinospora mayteni]
MILADATAGAVQRRADRRPDHLDLRQGVLISSTDALAASGQRVRCRPITGPFAELSIGLVPAVADRSGSGCRPGHPGQPG